MKGTCLGNPHSCVLQSEAPPMNASALNESYSPYADPCEVNKVTQNQIQIKGCL